MPPMTETERDAFLREPGILMRIATVDASGAPHVTPIWFVYEDEAIYFTPREMSAWRTHLSNDPRVSLCIDEQPLPYRKVLLRGSAQMVHDLGEDDVWRDQYRRIAQRYVPEEQAEDYVQSTIDQPRALFKLPLEDAEVRTWRMPGADEPQHGIWHSRYYRDGSLMAQEIRRESEES